jgi:FHS family glucose/mannose:H+ symporter-like MFS transporter
MPNFLTLFIAPIYFMTVSPMLIEMSKSTGISTGDLSLVITFFTVGIVTGQMTSVVFNRRFGKRKIIITAYLFVIFFLILLSFNNSQIFFYILYLLLGYTTGVIWIQSAKYILENKIKNKDRLTTIFLSFYPVGNMVAPLIGSSLIDNGISWRYSYYIIAGTALAILILFIFLKRDAGDKQVQEEDHTPIKEIFVNRNINMVFALGCLMLFFYCISETVMAAWSPTFLRTVYSFDIRYAGLAVTVFWSAVLLGRMIISVFAGKVNTNYVLLILSIMAVVAMAIFIPQGTVVSSLILVGFAGLGHSGIITLGVSSASTVYAKGRGILASFVFASINAGASAAPFLTRFVSRTSMALSVVIAPVSMGLVALTVIWKIIYEKKNPIRQDTLD